MSTIHCFQFQRTSAQWIQFAVHYFPTNNNNTQVSSISPSSSVLAFSISLPTCRPAAFLGDEFYKLAAILVLLQMVLEGSQFQPNFLSRRCLRSRPPSMERLEVWGPSQCHWQPHPDLSGSRQGGVVCVSGPLRRRTTYLPANLSKERKHMTCGNLGWKKRTLHPQTCLTGTLD